MPLISLTTDFGTKDHSVAAIKGLLYNISKDISIVDVNHEINAFDLIYTAYTVKNAARTFPDGSIHIAIVDMRAGNSRYLIVKRELQYYIVPDNGIICLMFPEKDFEAFAYDNLDKNFSYKELIAGIKDMVYHIINNSLSKMSVPTTSYKEMTALQPIVMENAIRGAVFLVDHFDNLIVNITKEMFENFVMNKGFLITLRTYRVSRIAKHYEDEMEGELVALFNDAGYLELAINKGKASQLLNANYGQLVMIERQ